MEHKHNASQAGTGTACSLEFAPGWVEEACLQFDAAEREEAMLSSVCSRAWQKGKHNKE